MKTDYDTNGSGELVYGMSVIICCFNSAGRLPDTLGHLLQQQVPEEYLWEVILVDNASTDETLAVAQEYQARFAARQYVLEIIPEARRGQFFARRTGVSKARYEYILFCDDDNWLQSDYVHNAIRMTERSIHFGAGGGQNLPATDAAAYPDWFETDQDKYALGIPAETSMEVTNRGFVLGAGLVTKKSLYLQMFSAHFPSLLKGRNGTVLTTGDDFEYCKRLILAGYKLYYDERLILHHFIPKERLTEAYRERLLEGIQQAGRVLDQYNAAILVKNKTKNKNRTRLLLLAPLRIALIQLGLSKRDLATERNMLRYLSPFRPADETTAVIKKFFRTHQKTDTNWAS